jgi:hypothetical protein
MMAHDAARRTYGVLAPYSCSQEGHLVMTADSTPATDNVAESHEALPVFERHITLRHDHPIRTATSAALGQDLPFEQADGGLRITIPRVDLLDLLILE